MPKRRDEFETYSREVGFDTYVLYDASNREEYICSAHPGALTSEASWTIYKLTYSGTSTRIVKKRYASGNDLFDKIADNYASYNYTDI